MDFANRTNTVGICSVSTVSQKTVALVMELDFVRSLEVALAVDVAKQAAMGHFEVEVSLVVVAVALIVTLEFADTFCSVG